MKFKEALKAMAVKATQFHGADSSSLENLEFVVFGGKTDKTVVCKSSH